MSDQNLLTRREFTVEWVLAVLAGATITITGCGGDDNNNSPGTNPTPQTGDKAGVISANHGHTAIVTAATLASPTAVTINMRAQATHNHTLTLTAAEVTSIAANARVEKISSTDDGHNHTVTFN